jgi:hypothetical protein
MTTDPKDPLATPCEIWPGNKHTDGYGVRIVNRQQVFVHRLAYCKFHGITLAEIGLKVVRHHCNNRACVNPEHLYLADRGTHNRGMPAGARRGTANRNSKLTESQVIAIRARYAKGEAQKAIAARYGITQTQVSHIVLRKLWKHI